MGRRGSKVQGQPWLHSEFVCLVLLRLEEDIRSSETGITNSWELPCGGRNWTEVLCRTLARSSGLAISLLIVSFEQKFFIFRSDVILVSLHAYILFCVHLKESFTLLWRYSCIHVYLSHSRNGGGGVSFSFLFFNCFVIWDTVPGDWGWLWICPIVKASLELLVLLCPAESWDYSAYHHA